MQVTIQGKLFPDDDQKPKIDGLMRVQSSAMRYSYNRICEDKSKSAVEDDLKDKFSELNSRYCRGGYFRAKNNYKSAKELVRADELESEEKVIFGGRKNFIKRSEGEITNEEWKRLRNRQVFCRGDKSKGGNLNLRFVEKDGELHLRINIGEREWIYVPAYVAEYEERLLEEDEPYGVRIIREDGGYKLRVNIEEEYEEEIDYEKGTVGLDFNHSTIDLAVTNDQGQLKDTKTIDCHNLTSSNEGKREWEIGNLAKEVVDYAKYWDRGIVIEDLSDLTRGESNAHKFVHKKFLEAVKRKAEKEGVKVDDVNPTFTSVIGKHKYSSYYHITVHQSAALVIARRGQGFSEHLRGLKTLLFGPSEGEEEKESLPNYQAHSWSLWRLMRDLPSRKGMNRKHSCQSSSGVESTRTIGSAERCSYPAEDGSAGRKIDIPGDGPSIDVKRTQHQPISPQGREAKNGSDRTRFFTVCYGSQYQEAEEKAEQYPFTTKYFKAEKVLERYKP